MDKKLHGQKNHPRITLITRKKAQAQRRAISAIKKSVLIRVIRGQTLKVINITIKIIIFAKRYIHD